MPRKKVEKKIINKVDIMELELPAHEGFGSHWIHHSPVLMLVIATLFMGAIAAFVYFWMMSHQPITGMFLNKDNKGGHGFAVGEPYPGMPREEIGNGDSVIMQEGGALKFRSKHLEFEFDLPASSYFVDDRPDYIRIQNYILHENEAHREMAKDEYYLEILPKLAYSFEDCMEEITEPVTAYRHDDYVAYTGAVSTVGGDAGGSRMLLCASRDGKNHFLTVTEDNADQNFSKSIFSSFRLIK